MFERLQDQNVFITGASSGIGRCTAMLFAHYGSNIIISARRYDKLRDLAGEIAINYPNLKIHCISMDVTSESSVRKGFQTLPDWAQHIDILVNNAGVHKGVVHVKDLDTQIMDEMIDTNLKSHVWVTQQVIPKMLQRNSGTIVNVGSVNGDHPHPNAGMFSATKSAFSSITKTLRMETCDSDVRIIEIKPGFVETDSNIVMYPGDKASARAFYGNHPTIPPMDVAESIIFAASRNPRCVISEVSVVPNGHAHPLMSGSKDKNSDGLAIIRELTLV
ncbi:hypothetical protein BB560_005279 [Smittium megazygosporum]|uniref:Oxidoreductase n=1 Tax=Smittium megazygosporum TaxID=133381 RepID=A0A2T9Z6X3_9FUNG|nr:hypothetical protein BB560_005279 [Smittium megazygosporum]